MFVPLCHSVLVLAGKTVGYSLSTSTRIYSEPLGYLRILGFYWFSFDFVFLLVTVSFPCSFEVLVSQRNNTVLGYVLGKGGMPKNINSQ